MAGAGLPSPWVAAPADRMQLRILRCRRITHATACAHTRNRVSPRQPHTIVHHRPQRAWRPSSAPGRCATSPAPAARKLNDVDYSEYDRNGILVTVGNADRAVYYTARKDAEVAGAIRLRSQSQGVWLEAETLRWEDASHRLFSGPEETVALTRDDGSQVTGTGLQSRRAAQDHPVLGTRQRDPGRGDHRGGIGGSRRPGGRSTCRTTRRQAETAR